MLLRMLCHSVTTLKNNAKRVVSHEIMVVARYYNCFFPVLLSERLFSSLGVYRLRHR